MHVPPPLLFATPQIIGDDRLLLKDGSGEVCDQSCMRGAEVGVVWCGRKPWLCKPFQLVVENNSRGVYKFVFSLALGKS